MGEYNYSFTTTTIKMKQMIVDTSEKPFVQEQFCDDWGFYVDIEDYGPRSENATQKKPTIIPSAPILIPSPTKTTVMISPPSAQPFATVKLDRPPSLTLEDMINLGARTRKGKEKEEDTNLCSMNFQYNKTTLIALICICLFL
jgi:hypothetical protein